MSGPPPPGPPPPPPAPPRPPRAGRLLFGVVLVLLGVGWLLDVLDLDVPWDLVLPSALILIGATLLLTSGSDRGHGGLLTAGIALTVVLALGSALNLPLAGIGDREVHPTTVASIRSEYRLSIGDLTIDLSDLPVGDLAAPARTTHARLGIGDLLVIVPEGLDVRVEARAGLGSVRVFGVEEGGIDVERVSAPAGGSVPLELVLSVGLGEVEVRRG